jgi:uncharacterized membrane protein (UPF0127 family)
MKCFLSPCPSPYTINVRRADGFFSRLAGLLFVAPLQPDQGLLLVPCAAVHTAFMRYAIDVVFLDRSGTIRKIVTRLEPWHMASCPGCWQTLELAAGEAARLKLEIGLSLSGNLPNFNQENSL